MAVIGSKAGKKAVTAVFTIPQSRCALGAGKGVFYSAASEKCLRFPPPNVNC